MPPAVRSAFIIAFWLLETARKDKIHVQPQKLQRLLFLAQAWYGALSGGRTLMPATFVADEMGPIEPNVHVALAAGCPGLDTAPPPAEVEDFLCRLWDRFGHHGTEYLTQMTKQTRAYGEALRCGVGAEIAFEAMCGVFADNGGASGLPQKIRQKVMRTQSGRAVLVRSWTPGARS